MTKQINSNYTEKILVFVATPLITWMIACLIEYFTKCPMVLYIMTEIVSNHYYLILLYGSVSRELGTTKFTNLIG